MKKHKLTQIAKKPIGTFYADNKPYKFYSNNYRRQLRKPLKERLLNGLKELQEDWLEDE